MLMFSINNAMFLKNGQDDTNACDEKQDNNLIFGLNDLQHALDQEVVKLSNREKEQHSNIDQLQADETKKALDSIHKTESCNVEGKNLLQFDGSTAINDFGKFLNLKVGPPTIANSISNTQSIAKGTSDNNSAVNTVQNVKSTTNADAEGEKNSIAVSNVIGNTEANSNNLAVDNSKAVNVIDNENNGNATAVASENSLAASSVKADQSSDTNTIANENSTAIGGTQMTSDTDSIANANEGSIADTKAITDEKSLTNSLASDNSTAIGVTSVNSDANSIADASNQSLAQSIAESQNNANTTTIALDNSASVGASALDSSSDSSAISKDGGNALSVSDAKSNVATDSIATNSSASVVSNTGGSDSNATSVSDGVATPYQNPIENQTSPSSSIQTVPEEYPISLTPSSTPLQSTRPIQDKIPEKIPMICDEIPTITNTDRNLRTDNIMDKIINQVDKVGPSEVAKETILKSVSSQDTNNEKTIDLGANRDLCSPCSIDTTPELRSRKNIGESIKDAVSDIKLTKDNSRVLKTDKDITLKNSCEPIPINISLKKAPCDLRQINKEREREEERRREEEEESRREEEEEHRRRKKEHRRREEEIERKKDQEEREKLKAERQKLREDNERLRREKEEAEDKARALKKAEERRKRKEKKLRDRRRRKALQRRYDRQMDINDFNMCSPNIEAPDVRIEMPENPNIKYNPNCKMGNQISQDFEQGIKDANLLNDPKFSDKTMFEDKIKEFDMRNNDENVFIRCQNICKNENLGNFVDSEIQDIIFGKFLFKCKCSYGITDWFLYDDRTKKTKVLGSSTQNLLDSPEDETVCDDQNPTLQAHDTNSISQGNNDQAENCTEDSDDDDEISLGGATMPSDLGDCFNFFIENKFKKLHNRLNKLKSKNTSYINDIHKRQLNRKNGKSQEMVDKTAESLSGTDAGDNTQADKYKNMQSNVCDMKNQLNDKNTRQKNFTPEDHYFKNRNAKDEARFNQNLQKRFESKKKSEDKRFNNRFQNVNRYSSRDKDEDCKKKPAVRAAESKTYIADEVGKIKKQNRNYLDRIKSMFGGSITDIESA